MSESIRKMTVKEAANIVKGKSAMILCHINPDGDALGSATALAEVLRLTGGRGTVVSPSPVPERLRFITGDGAEYRCGMESEYELILTVDTASEPQLGELARLAKETSLSFDHHENGSPFSPYVLDADAPAAGIIIYKLFKELEKSGDISGNASGALRRIFAAIASDTGSFKYSNATPEAFAVCGEICGRLERDGIGVGSAPIDSMTAADISAALFDNLTKKDVDVRRLTYGNLRYICGGQIAVSVITEADRRRYGLTLEDCCGMVDHVRAISGTAVGIALKQSDSDPDVYRGSARANIDFDVAAVAEQFGGGGHRLAAGFRVNAKTAEEAVRSVGEKFGAALGNAGISIIGGADDGGK